MKLAAVIRGGVGGGIVAAAALAAAGRIAGVTLPPWNWSSSITGSYGAVLAWSRAAAMLAPFGAVLGLITAAICAMVFELVTRRAAWWRGAIVGLVLGAFGTMAVSLVPWFMTWYGFAYMPSLAPLGTTDPVWAMVSLAAAGVVMGAIAGAGYGRPVHAAAAPRVVRWREVYRRV